MCGTLAHHAGETVTRIVGDAQANLPRGQSFQIVKQAGVVRLRNAECGLRNGVRSLERCGRSFSYGNRTSCSLRANFGFRIQLNHALRGMRADKRLNLRPDSALRHANVIIALQIKPDFRGNAEVFAKAQGSVGSD